MELGSVADWISSLSDIVLAVAAATAAYQGIKSLSAWKAEATGRRRMELAEDVLVEFHEVRDLMRAIRSPLSYSSEGKTRKREPGESNDVAGRKDTYFVILERFDARRDVVARLMGRRYRMVAWFTPETDKAFEKLQTAIQRVLSSAQMLVESVGDGTREADPKSWKEWEGALWRGASSPDPIATQIDEAVSEIEAVCRPILEAHRP